MKKILVILSILLSISVYGQSKDEGKWSTKVIEADELLDRPGMSIYIYEATNASFSIGSCYPMLVLRSSKKPFKYDIVDDDNEIMTVRTGLYSTQGKLVKKLLITFKPTDTDDRDIMAYTLDLKECESVVSWIKNKNGYVRFVMPIKGEEDGLNLIVPCNHKPTFDWLKDK